MSKREEIQKAIENARRIANENAYKATPVDVDEFDNEKKKVEPLPVAAAKTKKERKPRKDGRSPKARDARMKTRGRLPAGSEFKDVKWDGDQWRGRLVVPLPLSSGPPEVGSDFRGRADGLFALLESLDVMYWECIAKEEAEAKT